MADFQLGAFRPDTAGIVETWTSAGMQGALREAAASLGAAANSSAHLHGPHGDLYSSGVDVLGFTAVGYVTTNGRLGQTDQQSHHTLDALNH